MILLSGANLRRAPFLRLLLFLSPAVGLLILPEAQALRLVDYNVLNYPGTTGTARAPYYRTILQPLAADVIVLQEVSSTAPAQFLNEVLNVIEPGEWASVPFIDGNDTDATLFYKPAKVQFLGQSAFYPNPSNPLRLIHAYRLMPAGYASQGAALRIYTGHLKASTGYEAQRLAECVGVRDSMNAMPPGAHAILCGDLNFYRQSTEPGYAKLLESQSNNNGRLFDPLPSGDWHDAAAFAPYHTQSPCLSGTCANGAATGGMDDRFDFILPTYSLGTGQGLAVIPNTSVAVGNDGFHLNENITDAPVIPEGAAYATALKLASDHLPLRIDLRLPAEIACDPELMFATVILGAPDQSLDLIVANPTSPPADSLNCTLLPPAGFSATPALTVAAGESGTAVVSMAAEEPGLRTGDLLLSSDSPDNPELNVALSGTILEHATASLDSSAVILESGVDFGDHEPGAFTTQRVRVHNFGFDELQARLWVQSAEIAGGDGRFFLVDPFTELLIGGAGVDIRLAFDDNGAVLDSTYSAVLSFASADETLPGATVQPDLVVSLRARVTNGALAVDGSPWPPVFRLYPPVPNPLSAASTLRLDLPRGIEGALEVFDPAGRRVALLRQGSMAPGRHVIRWNGQQENGTPAGSGIYFIRLSAPGVESRTVRLAIVR